MKKLTNFQIRYTKPQRTGIIILVLLIALSELILWFTGREETAQEFVEFPEEILAMRDQLESGKLSIPQNYFQLAPEDLEEFNPNNLSENDWQKLGFSLKQVQTILKYKKSLGGKFASKQEIRNCFVISKEKYAQLAPYILLPESSAETSIRAREIPKPETHYQKFNPNNYAQKDWQKIGFSEKQAVTILKYRKSLGGKFHSLEEIKKCFVIPEEKFNEMKPFMVLEAEAKNENKSKIEGEISLIPELTSGELEKFNPNSLTREGWQKLGLTENQVNTLFKYKNSLGGKFKDAETLRKCYSISPEKFSEIAPYLDFDMN